MKKTNCVHVWFSDAQIAALNARSLLENRSVTQIVKNAAITYVTYGQIDMTRRKIIPPVPVMKQEVSNENI